METNKLIKGGKADNLSVADIAKKHGISEKDIQKQIDIGMPIEEEHVGKDKGRAREICMDHLDEFPDYYDRLLKMEEEGKKALKESRKTVEDVIYEIILEANMPEKDENREYGLPEVKKYPMFDAKHVRSAAKLFDHGDITPEQRDQLAAAIKRQAKKYGVSLDFVTDQNELYKYLH